jgi:hypothetical protein
MGFPGTDYFPSGRAITLEASGSPTYSASYDLAFIEGTTTGPPAPTRSGILSHIAAGGGWTTAMTLANISSVPITVRLLFYADDGSALSLPVNVTQRGVSQAAMGSTLIRDVDPNSTLLIETGGPSGNTAVGWADVLSTGTVGGFAIFRSTPQFGPPSEGTVPLETSSSSELLLPYDNASGFTMGVALANLSTSSASITATAWDDSGTQVASRTLTISGNGHASFVLVNELPQTGGKRGMVRFQSTATGGIAGLGLRFSPFGTFTSVPAM